MEDPKRTKRRIILEEGSLVVLHPDGPAGGFPMVATVDRVSKGWHWFLGSCDPIKRGETVVVESGAREAARHVTRAKVVASSPGTFALALDPLWEQVQQRAFVRIFAHGLQVRVLRPTDRFAERLAAREAGLDPVGSEAESESDDEPEQDSLHDLIDISAVGIRFRSARDYEPDEQVICHFELPGSDCFVLPARVVRPAGNPLGPHKESVAVEFIGLDENNRSQLLRWIYREQVRRHREEARKKEREEARREARKKTRR